MMQCCAAHWMDGWLKGKNEEGIDSREDEVHEEHDELPIGCARA